MSGLFRANTFIEVISLIRKGRRQGRALYSYRQLADKLGYRSARSLAMVHKGQRLPNQMLVSKLVRCLSLDPQERELVTLLAQKAIAEHKQQSFVQTEEKIRLLKLSVENSDRVNPLSLVYADEADRENLRKLFQIFLIEISCLYGKKHEGKTAYRIGLYLKTCATEAHKVCAEHEADNLF